MASSVLCAQAQTFKPGDRVECDWLQNGTYDKGTVVPFNKTDFDQSGRWYRVDLDKDTIPGSTVECLATRMRPLVEKKPVEVKSDTVKATVAKANGDNAKPSTSASKTATHRSSPQKKSQALKPKMAGKFPSLPGTAWKIDFGKGVTGTVFLFCKKGRWEIVPQRAGSIGAVGKSYRVAGSTLTTVNADDGKVQKWKMSWSGRILSLFDGKVILRLHYNGTTSC
jgi:hypothetical protein